VRSRVNGTAGRSRIIRKHLRPDRRIFVGVTAPGDPRIETAEDVRDRVLEASEYIPIEQLGTTTTADSRLSSTIPPRAVTRLLPRSGRGARHGDGRGGD